MNGTVRTLLCTLFLAAGCSPGHAPESTLITDVIVVDGTGAPGVSGSVRITNGVIAAMGELEPEASDVVVDGGGAVLAPGFIDPHSHHDRNLLEMRDAVAAVSQGITTIVVGQDGGSPSPLIDFFGALAETPAAVNVASYSGHGTLRRAIMGDDQRRPATEVEIAAMADLLRADLNAGALGLSTGLEYVPAIYSTTEEVIALARVSSEYGGRYISHMRSEDRDFFDALDEIIRIGREADLPVQVSHMKLGMKSLWGRAGEVLDILDAARAEGIEITADVYPWSYWQSTMTVLFPNRDYTREAAAFALDQLAPPETMIVGRFTPEPSYAGMTLAEIAERRAEDPVTTYLSLIDMVHGADAPENARETIVAQGMSPADIARFLEWPHTVVCTDGELEGPHPRGYGSFTKVLREQVRESGRLTIEEAVHRMTAKTAENLGLADRGSMAVGAPADLVLFDPATVAERADFEAPHQLSVGVLGVWVNGLRVWDGSAATGVHPGVVLRRP